MIDAHCHLNATYTSETVKPILDRFFASEGECLFDVTTTEPEFYRAMELAHAYPGKIFTCVGIHPEECHIDNEQEVFDQFDHVSAQIDTEPSVVAIGETGFDYLAISDDPNITILAFQEKLLRKHIELASAKNLPLVIHARGTSYTDPTPYKAILLLLTEYQTTIPVYFHSYGGDVATALEILERGYYLGINGIVTYSNTQTLADVVAIAPLSQLLLETDAPYLIPSNMDRSLLGDKKVNEPRAIFFTAKRIAAVKKIAHELVLAQTAANAKRFFNVA